MSSYYSIFFSAVITKNIYINYTIHIVTFGLSGTKLSLSVEQVIIPSYLKRLQKIKVFHETICISFYFESTVRDDEFMLYV